MFVRSTPARLWQHLSFPLGTGSPSECSWGRQVGLGPSSQCSSRWGPSRVHSQEPPGTTQVQREAGWTREGLQGSLVGL